MTYKSKQSNNLVNFVGIILIIMAIALTYSSEIIDFDDITAPFEEAMEGTFVGDWITEAKQARLERELEQTETPAQYLKRSISEIPGLSKAQKYYISYQSFIEKFENSVAEIPNKFVIVICILLLFAIKSIIVLIPASATCLVTSLLFDFKTACIINFAGYALIFTGKYIWGKYVGEGYVSLLIKKSKFLSNIVQNEENGYGTGNPLALFIMRLVPTISLNAISAMYGHMGYNYWKFLILSLLGVSIRIVTVTAIGCNVSEPFSKEFAIPLILILFVTGFSMIALSIILRKKYEKGEYAEDELIEDEEEPIEC